MSSAVGMHRQKAGGLQGTTMREKNGKNETRREKQGEKIVQMGGGPKEENTTANQLIKKEKEREKITTENDRMQEPIM